MDRSKIDLRWRSMRDEMTTWRSEWIELRDYIHPFRGIFEGENPNKGSKRDRKLYNNSPYLAMRTCAAGLMTGMTPASRPWFKLGLDDPDLSDYGDVRGWLDRVQRMMYSIFAKSNIYNVLYSVYEELAAFGTAACIIQENYDTVIRGRTFTVGEYALSTNGNLTVDTFSRFVWMPVHAVVSEFGINNVTESTRSLYNLNQMDQWIRVKHIIEPNDTRIPGMANSNNKKYRSVYWEEGSPHNEYLRISGYDEFPVLSPRWDVVSSDIYGRGPGFAALSNSKMIQVMEKDKLQALDKLVNPPLVAPGSAQNYGVNTLPGGISWIPDTAVNVGIKPAYQVNPDIGGIQQAIADTTNLINRSFYADLFLMLSYGTQGTMTAREVVERHEEKLQNLGPVVERLQTELLRPLIERTFAIMERTGILPPPPESVQGMDLKIEYVSTLSQAQKMVGTAAKEQIAAFTSSLLAINPEITDAIDWDELVQQYADDLGLPEGIVRADDDLEKIRTQRAQQMQAAQQSQQMQQMIQGAKTLSETDLTQQNALTALTGGLMQ